VRTFRQIERHTDERSLALVSELRALSAKRWNQFAHFAHELHDDRIDVKHL
jgi:hypothetical protein